MSPEGPGRGLCLLLGDRQALGTRGPLPRARATQPCLLLWLTEVRAQTGWLGGVRIRETGLEPPARRLPKRGNGCPWAPPPWFCGFSQLPPRGWGSESPEKGQAQCSRIRETSTAGPLCPMLTMLPGASWGSRRSPPSLCPKPWRASSPSPKSPRCQKQPPSPCCVNRSPCPP